MSDPLPDFESNSFPEDIDPDSPGGQSTDSIELAYDSLVGLLAIGAEEAARRLEEMQQKLDADSSLWRLSSELPQKSMRQQAWYFGVGFIQRGQRRLRSDLRRGFERTGDSGSGFLSFDRAWLAAGCQNQSRDALENAADSVACKSR